MQIEIINDTNLDIIYDVEVNSKTFKQIYELKQSFKIDSKDEVINIHIFKDNIWSNESKFNSLFMILYTLDLMFGNLSESDNLPFNIEYNQTFSNVVLDKKICLSNIINVNEKYLNRWKRVAVFQTYLILFLIIIVGVILSFIFNLWIKTVFLISVIILDTLLLFIINKKINKLFIELKSFV